MPSNIPTSGKNQTSPNNNTSARPRSQTRLCIRSLFARIVFRRQSEATSSWSVWGSLAKPSLQHETVWACLRIVCNTFSVENSVDAHPGDLLRISIFAATRPSMLNKKPKVALCAHEPSADHHVTWHSCAHLSFSDRLIPWKFFRPTHRPVYPTGAKQS